MKLAQPLQTVRQKLDSALEIICHLKSLEVLQRFHLISSMETTLVSFGALICHNSFSPSKVSRTPPPCPHSNTYFFISLEWYLYSCEVIKKTPFYPSSSALSALKSRLLNTQHTVHTGITVPWDEAGWSREGEKGSPSSGVIERWQACAWSWLQHAPPEARFMFHHAPVHCTP